MQEKNQTMKNLDWGKKVFMEKKLMEKGPFSEKLKLKACNSEDKRSQNYRHTQLRHKNLNILFE